MKDELHITSLVVHAMPASCEDVVALIKGLPDAQIHGSDAIGKLVVTLEGPTASTILDQVSLIQRSIGVINVAMVYQHVEALESLNTEIPHADHPT